MQPQFQFLNLNSMKTVEHTALFVFFLCLEKLGRKKSDFRLFFGLTLSLHTSDLFFYEYSKKKRILCVEKVSN